VLLVDWPNQDVPRALLNAGFAVLSANFARGTASEYGVLGDDEARPGTDEAELIMPDHDGDKPLVIRRIPRLPERVDAVALFRPEVEHAAITRHAVEVGARALWVQRGLLADTARDLAQNSGLTVIEDAAVSGAIQEISKVT
jgi:hypothetical protein